VEVGPGGDETVTLGGLPLDTRLVEAELVVDEEGRDSLATDNRAWAVRTTGGSGGVLLVTAGNGFLEKGLNLIPGVELFKAAPQSYLPEGDFALTVFDGFVPARLPSGNILIFGPTDSPLVPVSGTVELPQVGQVELNDPLLRFVDLSDLHMASAARMEPPGWARVLVRARGGEPLLIAGESEGRRVAAFAFDLHRSDLPLKVAFPILLANLVEWLRPSTQVSGSSALSAGEAITVRLLPEADRVVVTAPGGREVTLSGASGREVQFASTDELGIYRVRQFAGEGQLGPEERFAVNLFDRTESAISSRSDVGLVGSGAAPPRSGERPIEIWPWIVLASLFLLAVEWWVYNRAGRALLPRRGARTAAGKQG
jgi:Ca-activated chloride channel family protein